MLTTAFADSTHKVEKGDTLYSISRKYQITVSELRTANNLSENDVIKVGQKLIIPDADIGTAAALSQTKSSASSTPAGKTTTVTVQKGDTLYGIARKNGMSVADLMALNNLDSSAVIKVGQKLKVNAASETKTVTSTSTPSNNTETVIK